MGVGRTCKTKGVSCMKTWRKPPNHYCYLCLPPQSSSSHAVASIATGVATSVPGRRLPRHHFIGQTPQLASDASQTPKLDRADVPAEACGEGGGSNEIKELSVDGEFAIDGAGEGADPLPPDIAPWLDQHCIATWLDQRI
jgi:hypothetical protein